MSSLERKMKRNTMRLEFNEFTKAWRAMKQSGQLVNGKPLGKKPGFSEFKRRMAAHEKNQKLELEKKAKEAESKIDLEWKE